jgi:hypothetical protein
MADAPVRRKDLKPTFPIWVEIGTDPIPKCLDYNAQVQLLLKVEVKAEDILARAGKSRIIARQDAGVHSLK